MKHPPGETPVSAFRSSQEATPSSVSGGSPSGLRRGVNRHGDRLARRRLAQRQRGARGARRPERGGAPRGDARGPHPPRRRGRGRARARNRLARREIGVFEREKRLVHRSGREVWVLQQVRATHDNGGRPMHFIWQGRDVTEERRARAARVTAEERLRAVVSHAPIVLWAVDQAGVFTLSEGSGLAAMGPAAERMAVGLSALDFYGAVRVAEGGGGQITTGGAPCSSGRSPGRRARASPRSAAPSTRRRWCPSAATTAASPGSSASRPT